MAVIPLADYQNTYSRQMGRSPVRLQVNLVNLMKNVDHVRQCIGTRKIMAIVKADAYGLGAGPISKALESKGVDYFGVSNINEAFELKDNGITTPIFILSPFIPEEEEEILHNNFIPTINSAQQAQRLNNHAFRLNKQVPCFFKINTGMGRFGTHYKKAIEFIEAGFSCSNLSILGLYSHLAQADAHVPQYTHVQIERFQSILDHFKEKGITFPENHIANSAGIMAHPDSHFDLVRPGIMLYGSYADTYVRQFGQLEPVVTLVSHIRDIKHFETGDFISYGSTFQAEKPTDIAVVPIGYAEGFPLTLSNKGKMYVNQQEAHVVGRVTMDFTMIDVSNIPNIHIGDEVVIINQQQSVEDLADAANVLPHQILTMIMGNVSRTYQA